MAQLERSELLDLAGQYFPDNIVGDITPADLRLVMNALINSVLLPASDSLEQWPPILPLATYATGDKGTAEVESRLRLFKAKVPLVPGSFPGGTVPMPTGLSTDAYWREVSPEGPDYIGYEVVSRQLAINLLDDELVVSGRLYYIIGGAGTRAVLLRGLGPAAFEPDGYVVVPGTVDVPALSYFAARVNIRLSYAESLSYEVITYANLLARLADSPPLQGKIYLATNRLASAPNLRVVFWGDSPATPGHYVSQQATQLGTDGIGKYDLYTDTFTPHAKLARGWLGASAPLGYDAATGTFSLSADGVTNSHLAADIKVGSIASLKTLFGSPANAFSKLADFLDYLRGVTASNTSALALKYTHKGAWAANTPYNAYDSVINPSGQMVYALATFTSSGSYSAANWQDFGGTRLDPYTVSSTIMTAVTNGSNTWTNGELQATQPAGSESGMEFTDTTKVYRFIRGAAGTLVWVRMAKG
jgi:hypothetical protein